MNSKKIIMYIGVFFIAVLILNVYSSLLWDIKEAASQLDVNRMTMSHISAMIFCSMFGVLLEWERLISVFSKRISIKLNFKLILGLIIFLIGLFPPVFYLMEFGSLHLPFPKGGIGINVLFGMLNQFSNVQAILSVTAGTLIIKGISQKD